MLASAVAGLAAGGAYALLGVCVVFTYRVAAVVNFTAAATGALGAFTMVVLTEQGVAYAPAMAAGLLAGTGAATVLGLVVAVWFAEAPARTKAAVSVAMFLGVVALGLRLFGAEHPRDFPNPFSGRVLSVAGTVVTQAGLITVLLGLAAAVGAGLFLRRTRTGLRLRALSERPTSSALLGIPVRLLSVAMWAATGLLATTAIIVVAPTRIPTFASLSLLIVPALAAALIGLFRNLGLAFAGGIALGMLEGFASGIGEIQQYRGVLPFAVILVVLLWSQRRERWDEAR